MLRAAASKAQSEISKEEDTESELDFETNIKQMAEGFQKNEEKMANMKKKMAEPGSPKIVGGSAVRLSNVASMSGGQSSL